jgi:hypothetical protein
MAENWTETSKETQENMNQARERCDLVKKIHDNKVEQQNRRQTE